MPLRFFRLTVARACCGWLLVTPAFAQPPDALPDLLRRGRELIDTGRPREAVELLERHLGRVRSDPSFLLMLGDAYRIYLDALDQQGDRFTHEMFSKRLRVLEQGLGLGHSGPRTGPLVRGSRPEEASVRVARAEPAASVLGEQAAAAFARQQYADAEPLFRRMSLAGGEMSAEHRGQWAYCKLAVVVERLNAGRPPAEVAADIAEAVRLAQGNPKLEQFARQVQDEIRRRGGPDRAVPVAPRHSAPAADGAVVSESPNFRLRHRHPPEFAGEILAAAERHRRAAFAKFAPQQSAPWSPGCEIVLHAGGDDYAKATGQPADSPGHSTIKIHGGRVVERRIDLRADDPDLVSCVVPHEITHVVLAELFADGPLPRWADEGLAVLAEPRSKVDRYFQTMVRLRREGKLVSLDRLLATHDYPAPDWLTVFYVESVSVVEYLVNQRGPAAFIAFLRDAGREPGDGTRPIDAALQRHYGIRSVGELQQRWLVATFTEIDRRAAAGRDAAARGR